MRSRIPWFFGLLTLAVCSQLPALAAEPPAFAWKDGDRVVLVGDTFIERDQRYGYLETRITAENPSTSITFRNLGWSGDTPLGLSRSGFGKPDEGWRQLRAHVLAEKPSVLIVGYGMAESFDGEAGLSTFVSEMNTLLDAVAPLKARLILLSPIAHEDLGRPLPDPTAHNVTLAKFRDAIHEIAEERSAWFVDLFEPTRSAHDYGIDPLTENGIHPSAYGYWYLSSVIAMELSKAKSLPSWQVSLDRARTGSSSRPKLSDVQLSDDGARFRALDAALPPPLAPRGAPKDVVWMGGKHVLRVAGLKPGAYQLAIDGKTVARADASLWGKGFPLDTYPEIERTEALRRVINAKNQLYFYRWRPQNETYLFGFRKHEQGNNAAEIPRFDPLIDAQEKAIAGLRAPVPHDYELTRVIEADGAR